MPHMRNGEGEVMCEGRNDTLQDMNAESVVPTIEEAGVDGRRTLHALNSPVAAPRWSRYAAAEEMSITEHVAPREKTIANQSLRGRRVPVYGGDVRMDSNQSLKHPVAIGKRTVGSQEKQRSPETRMMQMWMQMMGCQMCGVEYLESGGGVLEDAEGVQGRETTYPVHGVTSTRGRNQELDNVDQAELPKERSFELARTESPQVLSAGRKAFQRKHMSEYMQKQKVNDGKKIHIPTDRNGDITALKTVFHRAIRDVAGRVLDVSVINFCEHPELSLNFIYSDLAKQFLFNPPLRRNYVCDYLKDSLCTSRYQWRCYWMKHRARHPNCPARRYDALVAYWQTPEAAEESCRMKVVRLSRQPRGAPQGTIASEFERGKCDTFSSPNSSSKGASRENQEVAILDSDDMLSNDGIDLEKNAPVEDGVVERIEKERQLPTVVEHSNEQGSTWENDVVVGGVHIPVRTIAGKTYVEGRAVEKDVLELRVQSKKNADEIQAVAQEVQLARKDVAEVLGLLRRKCDRISNGVGERTYANLTSGLQTAVPVQGNENPPSVLCAMEPNMGGDHGARVDVENGRELEYQQRANQNDRNVCPVQTSCSISQTRTDRGAEESEKKKPRRRGRPPSAGGPTGKKRRVVSDGVETEAGHLLDLSQSQKGNEAVVKRPKPFRTRKKPVRFGGVTQSSHRKIPRSGLKPLNFGVPVWVLHPEHQNGIPVAYGKTGHHWKTSKVKHPEAAHLTEGVQLVHIQHVFFTGIPPMYASKQPQFKVLDDVLKSNSSNDFWVQWNTDYLLQYTGS